MAACKQPPLPPESMEEIDEVTRETKWKRFHPFRVVRKIFRRRVKRESDASKKSWSTSELQSVQEDDIGKPEVSSALKIGFSVSHDSIFSPESSANAISGEPLGISPGSSLSINHTSIKNMFKDELFSTIHLRRNLEDEDDDTVLQHNPPAIENLQLDLKERYSASSFTRHDASESYKHSLEQTRISSPIIKTPLVDRQLINTVDVTTLIPSAPLNHKAALHKIAVKPKRTHGLPGRRKKQIAAAKEQAFSMADIKEKEERSIHVAEVSKSFTETTSSKQISIQSSEWQVSSISYKEAANSIQDTLVEEKTNLERRSPTLITKEHFEGYSKNFNDEVTKAFVEGLISKGGNPSQITLSTESKEFKSKLMNSQPFIDNSIAVVEDSSSTSIDLSKSLTNSNTIEMQEPLQSMTTSKLQSVFKNVNTNENAICFEKEYVVKDNSLAFNKDIDDDTNFVFQKDISTGKIIESKNEDYMHKSKLKDIYDSVSSNDLNMKVPEIDKGIKPCNIPGINIALKTTSNDEQSLSSLCFEEESVLSTMSVKESGIYVSHHSSAQSDFNTVTEAHNFAAVDEVLNQASGSKCEPWISSVDILSPRKIDADVTVNSATSTICDNKIKEEKVTISVNSKSEKLKSRISSYERVEKQSLPTEASNSNVKTTSHQSNLKDKKPLKTVHKNNLQENSPSNTNAKNVNVQKRVSVEIVPFSQRMKERKYQPISFINKDSPEQHKTPNIPAADKKLMEQKLGNNKELSTNVSTKPIEKGELPSEKKSNKPDKLQYPVQIRVHKTRPNSDIKDKSIHTTPSQKELENSKDKCPATEVKFSTRASKDKLSTTETKLPIQTFKDKIAASEVKFTTQSSKEKPQPTEVKFPAQQLSKEKVVPSEIKLPSQMIKDKMVSTEVKHFNQSVKVNQNNILLKEENKIEESSTKKELHHTFTARKNTQANIENEAEFAPEANLKMNSSTEIENKVESEIPDPNVKQQSSSEDPEPELLRVFARRSIKQKHCDKEKTPDHTEKNQENTDVSVPAKGTVIQILETPRETAKLHSTKNEITKETPKPHSTKHEALKETPKPHSTKYEAPKETPKLHSTKHEAPKETPKPHSTKHEAPKETPKPHSTKHELKKKSKSFCEKAPRAVSPLKEMNLIPGETLSKLVSESAVETIHPRQRLASVSDVPIPQRTPPPPVKEDLLGEQPSWLQLAQQRREMRERKERLLLGGSPNSFMDPSNKPAARSSKVWDMVNNFQKLQMT